MNAAAGTVQAGTLGAPADAVGPPGAGMPGVVMGRALPVALLLPAYHSALGMEAQFSQGF